MKKRILITGISGFIGHHVAEHILKNTDWDIIGIDKLGYASNGFDRLRDVKVFDDSRVKIFATDLCNPFEEGLKKEIGDVNFILHMAAESHVDNSITNPVPFVQNNINSTLYLLEYARELNDKGSLEKFIYFGTDESFGTAPEGIDYKEGDRHNPGNPYSASKAGSENICCAYANTFGVPIMITNTMNVIGERQHPEKFLPLVINKTLIGDKVLIHANKERTEAGKRHYIHARNVADGVVFILKNIKEFLDNVDASKGKFNIVGEKEYDNLSFARLIAKSVGKELNYELVDFHSARPGHDLRYSLDGSKMKTLGWEPPMNFEETVDRVVKWTLAEENEKWLKN